MDAYLLRAIQHRNARVAMVVPACAARVARGVQSAAPATSSSELSLEEPSVGVRLGRVNIFLRDCLYTTYLRDDYDLALAESFFGVPLDSITGARLCGASRGALPSWETVRGLSAKTSAKYQAVSATLAAEKGIAGVHLDALWWGEREDAG